MARGQCPPSECVPDVIGICKFCGHEVVTPVDDDGNPLPLSADNCFCTESQIVAGCSIHDIEKFEPSA